VFNGEFIAGISVSEIESVRLSDDISAGELIMTAAAYDLGLALGLLLLELSWIMKYWQYDSIGGRSDIVMLEQVAGGLGLTWL
jgi:hypothetical protein